MPSDGYDFAYRTFDRLKRLVPVPARHRVREAHKRLNRRLSEIDRLLGRPTVFHVTHWKAGSQWVRALLEGAASRRMVEPKLHGEHLTQDPILPGRIYPASYMTRQKLEELSLPEPRHVFMVMRDLRDTAVSYYYSARYSHPLVTGYVRNLRERLMEVEPAQGILDILDGPVNACARIQMSWIDAGVPLYRYEDLLEDTEGTLASILDHCEISLSRHRLQRVVQANSFKRLSGGRRKGQEDVHSHFRKGVVGDWRNHFTPAITQEFKKRFGEVLVKTGYEQDLDW